ncbi:MAG: sirohydrochlorin cobaltochelatase [Tyzzerella sp.]|nr:sirohydrochlorin cobaltochelatase [Tyzzerella sp.]
MKTGNDKAILVVSFGTSHKETYQKTIAAIENEIQEAYADYPLYRAWTSNMIRRIVEKRDNLHVFSVTEALEQMYKDGVNYVVVQPTHVLNGTENTIMEKDIDKMRDKFDGIAVGAPLLSAQEDIHKVTEFITKEWHLQPDEMLVYVGHGSEHDSNVVYSAVNEKLQAQGHTNIILGTMKPSPSIAAVIEHIKNTNTRKILLAPFMIVAGSHAVNELAGDAEDSWKSVLESEGYEVQCVLKGLGEYPIIRQLFVEHLKKAHRSQF